jgi:hypothetical protein
VRAAFVVAAVVMACVRGGPEIEARATLREALDWIARVSEMTVSM